MPKIGYKQSLEHREKIGIGNRGKIVSEKTRKMISEIKRNWYKTHAHVRPLLGKSNKWGHHSEETKKKLRNLSLGRHHSKETINKMRERRKKFYELHPDAMLKLWQNSTYREKQIKAIMKGLMKRPTSLEQQFIKIIEKYNLPYKYVGDGSFLIGFKNPDFVNVNGEKICIEVRSKKVCELYDKMSFEEYEKQRVEHFDKYGWKCLMFIVDRNNKKWILNEQEIIEKIRC